METFTINDLSFYYPRQDKPCLQNLSFVVKEGEFFSLCGPSGSGKSTLLRQLKTVLAPHGVKSGEILFEGRALDSMDTGEQSARIGFVQQSPENQIVTDKVWHELAFGLESLGMDTPSIRARVAEMASFFSIEDWFYKNVAELSGGQKQLLNLASIMAMQPSVLILDEPTAQLDPIAASEFLAAVGRINRELGTTIIISEHRLEDVFPLADRVMVMDDGRIAAIGSPAEVGESLRLCRHSMFPAMTTPMRIWAAVGNGAPCPVSVRDGRNWLADFAKHSVLLPFAEREDKLYDAAAIEVSDMWFKYEKDSPDVVKGLNLKLGRGEFLALLGGNGTGKTTALSVIGGLRKAYAGKVKLEGKTVMLPQNPQSLFVKKTLKEDMREVFADGKTPGDKAEAMIERISRLCRLEELMDRHPYDLSGGEQQRAALAKVLLLEPEILLMDEPTKGMDACFKQTFAGIIKALQRRGVSILMVSHDLEFCAEHANRCALFFDGSIVSCGKPADFFSGNNFYTSSANRMSRQFIPRAVTASQVIEACGGKPGEEAEIEDFDGPSDFEASKDKGEAEDMEETVSKLPVWRKVLAVISGLAALYGMVRAVGLTDLSSLVSSGGLTGLAGEYAGIYAAVIGALFVFVLATSKRGRPSAGPLQVRREYRKLPRRTAVAAVMILLLIPVTIFVGIYYLGDRKYYFIAMCILLETMLPFALVFEGRKPQARELIIVAVLCAIGVAGRAAFFMLPSFKPVMAVTIIAGVAFGAETGFLVGSMTMLASNVMFGQGPWTPWQMFAMGIIGFFAGVLFRKGLLRRSRGALASFGAVCAIVVYGGIMNPAAALMWVRTVNWNILLSYYITGFPVDVVHACATAFFLWVASEPMLEKLDRVKVKYGLVEQPA